VGAPLEFGIYLPQVGFSYEELRERALLCEELGIHSLWFMDHLYPPEMPQVPSFEAWTLATALLAQTTRLRIGHLVLSNTFRHPALLAKMATSLDVISGGRLELGLGSGSYAEEHARAGIPWRRAAQRARELDEALSILTSMFREPTTSFAGEHYQVRDLPNLPPPVQRPRPPIHVGGAGERFTLPLVARYADVWNCPTYALAELERKRDALFASCAKVGRDPRSLRISQEAVLVLVGSRDEIPTARALAERRFGGPGWGLEAGGYVGTPDQIAVRVRENAARGISFFVLRHLLLRLLHPRPRAARDPAPLCRGGDPRGTRLGAAPGGAIGGDPGGDRWTDWDRVWPTRSR
jgi:alkanesulfonate monooxygenase SsuD/methylene tetrahydromethanopterin reductase-like flavin-dependent oxidoreductase (luciferase family)